MKTPAVQGNTLIGSLIEEALALNESYPPDRVKLIKKTMEQILPQFALDELKADIKNFERLDQIVRVDIPLQAIARRDDNLGFIQDDLLALCEKLIKIQIATANEFEVGTRFFLSKQLCGLDISPFNQADALTWVQGKLTEHGGDEGYVVELETCECSTCIDNGLSPRFKIDNKVARQRAHHDHRVSGISMEIIEIPIPRSRSRNLNDLFSDFLGR
jgi:hypothetical protein